MMNNVNLIGRTTKEVDLRYTPQGTAVANLTIAINKPKTDNNPNPDPAYINIVIWRKQAETISRMVGKGSQIGVSGRLDSRTYQGGDGKTVFVTEVIADDFNGIQFLNLKDPHGGSSNQNNQQQNNNQGNQQQNNYQGNNQGNQGQQNYQQNQQQDPFKNNGRPIDISDDDLPF